MSNPAVITLADASSRMGKFKRFVLEDNIGESIHLHIDNMRVDFTINEFLEFSQIIRSSVIELDILKGYSVNDFDESFLKECSPLLANLEKIEIEEIKLSSLSCIVRSQVKSDLEKVKLRPIKETPAYQYLSGNKSKFIAYNQLNYLTLDNEQRLSKLLESINDKNYPDKNKHIILFNGQNIIRDGQHRAAILAYLYGLDYSIKVMRFYFHENKHRLSIQKSNIKTSLVWALRKLFRIVKPQIKKMIR